MAVSVHIKNYKALKKELEKKKAGPKKAMKQALNDLKKRAPTWVAAEVSKNYGVKKAEITDQKIGKVKIEGNTIKELKFVYTGRVLTPTHFGMTPKAPGQNAYTLKAQIVRGQKATLGKVKKLSKKQREALGKNFTRSGSKSSYHSPIMLMHTGNAQAGGTNYIPFQRKSADRKDVKAIKTVSLPQMISGERAHEDVSRAVREGVEKRVTHYLEKYMG